MHPPRDGTSRPAERRLLASRLPGARHTSARDRGTRNGAGPNACATLQAARRSAAAGDMVAWKAVSKQATAGTVGRIWLTRSRPRSDIGWCSGARSTRASRARTTSASTRTGSVNLPPPWTTRCPTASIGLFLATISRRAPWSTSPLAASRSSELTRLSSSSTDSLRVLEPAFTSRTRTWPRRSVGPGPTGDVGIVFSGDPGISARPRPFVFHLLAQGGRVGT